MKVSREKYTAIKRACMERQNPDKVASKFGVSCTTVRRIKGSLNYEAYKGSMAKPKKGSLTNATASGKKKAGSSSSTTKPKTTDNAKSNLNKDKDKYNKNSVSVSKVTTKLNTEHPVNKKDEKELSQKINEWVNGNDDSKLIKKYYDLLDNYVKKCDELKSAEKRLKYAFVAWVILFIAFIIAAIK